MNKIEILINKSEYDIYEKGYYDFCIDGNFLNYMLNNLFPGKDIKGLVPPLDGWIDDEIEKMFVVDRIITKRNMVQVCPILICPDDQDLSCSTIVTKISEKENEIIWENIGYEQSYRFRDMESFGCKVDWFGQEFKMVFNKKQYYEEISKFPELKNIKTGL